MFGIHEKLKQREVDKNCIKTSLVGAGAMGAGIIIQMTKAPGMEVDIVVDRAIERAIQAYKDAGIGESQIVICNSITETEKALKSGKKVCTTKAEIAWSIKEIDILIEATGVPEIYADIALNAILNKKHVVTLNIEGDVCIGHILKRFADNAGVVYTGIYGDEPGCVMELYSEAAALGLEVVAVGRNDFGGSKLSWNKETILEVLKDVPEKDITKNPAMFASFCDGSKTNEECCMMANAIGLKPDVRGMHGPTVSFEEFSHEVPRLLNLKERGGILNSLGVVERIGVPGDPVIGPLYVFVIIRANTEYEKVQMGKSTGCLGLDNRILYMPYHYLSVQAPLTIAYAALEKQGVIASKGNMRAADTITMAKKNIETGEIIDEMGGFCTAGRIEKASITKEENLLPFALAEGAKVIKPISKGDFLTYDDVKLKDEQLLIVYLRKLQDKLFGKLY